jgi:hypothetical protein
MPWLLPSGFVDGGHDDGYREDANEQKAGVPRRVQ